MCIVIVLLVPKFPWLHFSLWLHQRWVTWWLRACFIQTLRSFHLQWGQWLRGSHAYCSLQFLIVSDVYTEGGICAKVSVRSTNTPISCFYVLENVCPLSQRVPDSYTDRRRANFRLARVGNWNFATAKRQTQMIKSNRRPSGLCFNNTQSDKDLLFHTFMYRTTIFKLTAFTLLPGWTVSA